MSIQPTNPFHISRAYRTQQLRAVPSQARPAGNTLSTSITPTPAANPNVRSLVAAVVPGKIDFTSSGVAMPSDSAALPMYRHPADKNAAATAVNAGKRIDVDG